MNNLDVAGILRTYSEKARYCKKRANKGIEKRV